MKSNHFINDVKKIQFASFLFLFFWTMKKFFFFQIKTNYEAEFFPFLSGD